MEFSMGGTSLWHARLETLGVIVTRYSLVLIFLAFGLYKFTPQEAQGIQPLVAHSVGLFWLYRLFDIRLASDIIGVIEVSLALMMAVRPFSARISAFGSLGTAFALLNTLSFLFTTPGLDPQSSDAGFIVKDLTLLGAALWTAAEALGAVNPATVNGLATAKDAHQ
jgi:uncharacterized membrane protein YkgB